MFVKYTDEAIIRPAVAADVPCLLTLWHEAFPEDSGRDIRLFLERIDVSQESLITEIEGRPVSMVFMLPAVLQAGQERFPLQYIYAAGTRKDYRGRGLFGDLLRQALRIAEQQGCTASFLHPAQPSLCDYYARFGYRPFFYGNELTGGASSQSMSIRRVSADEYAKARLTFAQTMVAWEPRFVSYAVQPPCQAVMWSDGCALCTPCDDVLVIRDLLCEEEQQAAVCGALAAGFGCERYRCYATADRQGEPMGLLRLLGNIKIPDCAAPHMGLALD